MKSEVAEQTVTLDGVKYKLKDFNNDQLYWVSQIQNINSKVNSLKMDLDQLQVANNFFIDQIRNSFETGKEKENGKEK